MNLIERVVADQLGILKEYSQKLLNNLYDRYKKEKPDITDVQIKYYIDRFEQLKNSAKITQKDISKYSFAELEKLIDSFPTKTTANQNNTATVKGQEIYSKNEIEVYLGDTKDKCVTYRKSFENDTKQGYSWCISRSDASNMFNGYRFRNGNERIFYFVINRKLPVTDKSHVVVIHVFDGGKYGLSFADNGGDQTGLDWAGLVSKVPYLKEIPERVFEAKPLSDKEKELYELSKKGCLSYNLFNCFDKYELVKAYIEIHIRVLTPDQIENLLKDGYSDLVNLYINQGHLIGLNTLNILPEGLKKNYVRVSKQILDAGNDGLYYTNSLRIILMYQYKFITKDELIKLFKEKNISYLYYDDFSYLNSINQDDIIKILFSFLDSADTNSIDKKYQIMYAECADEFYKNKGYIDSARIRLMKKYNIHIDLLNKYINSFKF